MSEKTSYQKGLEAEQLAIKLLIKQNFQIVVTRLKNKAGEIDILANKVEALNDYYIFEVKKRNTIEQAKESISHRQIGRCINAFFTYAQDKNITFENIYLKAIIVTKKEIRLVNIDDIGENLGY